MRKIAALFLASFIATLPTASFAADQATTIEDLLAATGGVVEPSKTDTEPNSEGEASAVILKDNGTSKTLDIGKTGLPLPRFVSLKRDKVNVRKGPNETFGIAWTYTRKNLPVEIIAEYDNWRKVRDHFGEEGWVFHSLLSGSRYALISPWKTEGFFTIHLERRETSKIIAKLEASSLARVQSCDGTWCQLNIQTYRGFIKQEFLWGVYLGDVVN